MSDPIYDAIFEQLVETSSRLEALKQELHNHLGHEYVKKDIAANGDKTQLERIAANMTKDADNSHFDEIRFRREFREYAKVIARIGKEIRGEFK